MKNFITKKGRFIIIDIVNPIFVTEKYARVRINKEYFDEAKKTNRRVVVRTTIGEGIYDPWLMKNYKTVKEIFLRPDDPMKMYELNIPYTEKKPDEYFEVS